MPSPSQNFTTMGMAWLLEFAVFCLVAPSAHHVLVSRLFAITRSLWLTILMHPSCTGRLLVLRA